MLDLKRLLELAEKATPGPWTTYHASCHSESTDVVVANDPNDRVVTTCPDREPGVELANGRFIAEADPETVKALVNRCLEAEALLREIRSSYDLRMELSFGEDIEAFLGGGDK